MDDILKGALKNFFLLVPPIGFLFCLSPLLSHSSWWETGKAGKISFKRVLWLIQSRLLILTSVVHHVAYRSMQQYTVEHDVGSPEQKRENKIVYVILGALLEVRR